MNNRYYNMDIVRYIMALAVMIAHFNLLWGKDIPFFISSGEGVGGFFALSGFLMYASFLGKGNTRDYLRSRARKIMPPYVFIVLLSAIAFGVVSDLPIKDYITDSGLYKYLAANLTFLNWLHPTLPGIFTGLSRELSAINGSLWTMKVEWALYLTVPIFVYICHRYKCNTKATAALIIVLSVACRCVFTYLYNKTGSTIYEILGRQFFCQLSYFYCGMLIYFYRDIFSAHLLRVACAAIILKFAVRDSLYLTLIAQPIYLTTLVMALSMCPKDFKFLRHKHNLSYNIYLFHFPVYQILHFTMVDMLPTWAIFAVAVLIIIVLAYVFERFLAINTSKSR